MKRRRMTMTKKFKPKRLQRLIREECEEFISWAKCMKDNQETSAPKTILEGLVGFIQQIQALANKMADSKEAAETKV
jgi:hypothetical protein